MRRVPAVLLAPLLCLPACSGGEGGSATDSGTSGASGGSTGGSTDGSAGSMSSGTASTGGTGSSSGGSASSAGSSSSGGVCGNGMVEGNEACDDGNQTDGDGCEADCTASSGFPLWTVEHDGPETSDDAATGIAITPEGDLVVVGYQVVTGESRNFWMRKLSAVDGAEIWTVTQDVGMGQSDSASDVAVGVDGTIAVAGSVAVGPDDTEAWLAIYEADGAQRWSGLWMGMDLSFDRFSGVAIAADGSVWGAGSTYAMATGYDGLVRHVSSTGMSMGTWAYDGATSGNDSFYGVVAVPGSDDVIALGSQADLNADGDAWLVRIDEMGAEVWNERFDGGAGLGDFFNGATVDSAGDIVLTGGVRDGNTGNTDVWIAKHSATDGSALDSATWNGSQSQADWGNGVSVGSDDSVFVAGSSAYIGQGNNLFVGRFDSASSELWSDRVNGPADLDDDGYDIAALDDGAVVVGAYAVLGQGTNIWIRKYAP